MARRKVDKPTYIYWLIDIRPEIIAAGWGSGQPFYCGKTVKRVEQRLCCHKSNAKRYGNTAVYRRILECGEYIRAMTMEVVPPNVDWAARERHWIKIIRFSFNALNVSDGGDGAPGYIHTMETRAKISSKAKLNGIAEVVRIAQRKAILGKKHTAEHNLKISLANRGRKMTDEQRAKLSAALKGRSKSEEHKAKLSTALKGQDIPQETREKIRKSLLGRKHTPATREKMRLAAIVREARRAEARENA